MLSQLTYYSFHKMWHVYEFTGKRKHYFDI